MIPMWPQDSCFSPVVAGVGGLPFRWHDPCLPQWSLQNRNLEFLNLWNSETSIFISNSLSSLSFLRNLTTIDLAHYCPNKRTFLIFKTPKGKPFINLCKIESIRVKIVILSAAVSVFLFLHGGQGVSQFGTKKSITKVFGTFWIFDHFFWSFSHLFHGLDQSHLGGWGVIAAAIHVLAQGSASLASALTRLVSWT